MKKYKIKITENALIDMGEIYNYIALDLLVPEIAIKQYSRITDKIMSLVTLPERFEIIQMEGLNQLRRMKIDNYFVFYLIQDDDVIVTNVLYSTIEFNQYFDVSKT
ncbi:type II toxin-antitoxin system RelE/ParE family toxin [Anaerorhabdus furcosa]|uniref:Toxin ParE1/3/4 n=1 Tax=Anaerorhabdus furcosa TaxID=118967 RepID=A0A1T4L6C1_9FIRM|nr:type II toxin-antitoxin system RelE/ParE family toxin [Anaerorhabdus furcosa]SJZ50234.1 toxin ParE1/3/4 [Anaerorhabdus furcosa]